MFSYSFIASHLFLFPLFLSATAMTVPSPSLKNRAAHSSSLSLCLLTYLSTSHICHCNVDLGRGRKEASGSAVEADPIWTDRGCAETKPANRAGIRERERRPRSASADRISPHLHGIAKNNDRPRALSSAFGRLDTLRRTKLGRGSVPKLQRRDKMRTGRTSISGRSENLCGSSAGSPAESNTFITFRIIIFSVDLDAR